MIPDPRRYGLTILPREGPARGAFRVDSQRDRYDHEKRADGNDNSRCRNEIGRINKIRHLTWRRRYTRQLLKQRDWQAPNESRGRCVEEGRLYTHFWSESQNNMHSLTGRELT